MTAAEASDAALWVVDYLINLAPLTCAAAEIWVRAPGGSEDGIADAAIKRAKATVL